MKYKVTIFRDKYVDEFGEHEGYKKEKEISFLIGQPVWYVYRKWNKWVVRKCEISEMWYTNIFGVRFTNGWSVHEDWFGRIFIYSEKEKAMEYCVNKNKLAKVKVYYR